MKELNGFAARMRVARKARDLTQEQLAEAIGVSAETISNLERSKFSPTYDVLVAVIRALDMDPRDVLQSAKTGRKVSATRLEQEAVLHHVARNLDDRSMELLVEIAGSIQKAMSR